MNNTGGKLVTGVFWSFLERFGSQTVSLVISIILARLIAPEAYGIIAAAQIFTSIATTFVTGGFGSALIQKKDADDLDFSSMFFFNTFFSVAVYGVIYLASPALVRILNESYDYELLTRVIRVIGIGIIFSSFNSFYRSLLMRKLDFKKIFLVTLCGTLVSAAVGVYMAYHGYGVWAIVTQYLLSYIMNAILFVTFSKWRPKLIFSLKRLKPLVSYGGKLMLSSLLTTVYADLSSLVIGNRYESDDLAYYNKGLSFPKTIVSNIIAAINTALFPVMVTLKTKEEFKDCVRSFNQYSTFIITPLMFGLAGVSTTFISLLLTDKWLPCVVFLQLSCLDYALQPMGLANLQYWKASGRATLYLTADIVKKVIGIALLAIAVFMDKGVIWIPIAALISTCIGVIINSWPSKKFIDYPIWEQIKDILPQFILSTVMYVIVFFAGRLMNLNLIVELIIQIILGVLIYIGGAALFRMKELTYMKNIAVSKINSLRHQKN